MKSMKVLQECFKSVTEVLNIILYHKHIKYESIAKSTKFELKDEILKYYSILSSYLWKCHKISECKNNMRFSMKV